MLAGARIGATHTVIFGGFSADRIADRVNDCGAVLAITADGGWRRGNKIPLKNTMDKAVENCPTIAHMLVVNRTDDAKPSPIKPGRVECWHRPLPEHGAAIVKPSH